MTWSFTTNQTPATGAVGIYTLVSRLLVVGFTKVSDSDGTTYSSGGTQVTSGAAGAGGLGNSNAWVRLRWPTGTRELVLQRGSANTSWRITYSPTAFNTGSPSASVVPSSANSGIVLGAGTDGTPTFTSMFGSDGNYRLQCGANDASSNGFFLVTYAIGGVTIGGCLVFDPMTAAPVEDTDPCIFYVGLNGNSPLVQVTIGSTTTSTHASRACGWEGFGIVGGSFVTMPGWTYNAGGAVMVPNGLPSNFHNSKDDGFTIPFGRGSAVASPNGYKGGSTVMKWNGTSRATPSTFASRTRLAVGEVNFPWDGTTDPVS